MNEKKEYEPVPSLDPIAPRELLELRLTHVAIVRQIAITVVVLAK